ncbi:hypothetical protein IMG5_027880 [Ichthyophthirius multifiliis]|uniref:General transcription factor IIH subunit 4 n=1 Tax=Ichthyophthirius multifiliis TaxID=5932 RepID=G0QLA7_ICHMU|nr:hypothetical protein IMG5_027880 [Ichthyophthirius multifiliis]EGR33999.1 hypothetical protein IMG5_027880 [Ichthyophthirius multifiliis]|eukprot:XP_004039303.1 hypothetical protein IMG5_027880 [Ichthyophthirius multifiliis]
MDDPKQFNFLRTILVNKCHNQKKLQKLFSNKSTVLTTYRCIDLPSQEIIQRIIRLNYQTKISNNIQQILQKYIQKDEEMEKFKNGNQDLYFFKLLDFTERGKGKNFVEEYFDISINGLENQIQENANFGNESMEKMKENAQIKWKQLYSQLMNRMEGQAFIEIEQREFSPKISKVLQEKFKNNLGLCMEFILQDTNAQIHQILFYYCQVFAQMENIEEEDIINFIITLSNLDVNKTYFFNYRSEYAKKQNIDQKFTFELKILSDLAKLGMIKEFDLGQQKKVFGITPLIWQFCYRSIDIKTINAKIIVETNFNLYAYLDYNPQNKTFSESKYIRDLLKKFSKIHYTFPHLIVAQLTEAKMKQAFNQGITSKLLIEFFHKTSDAKLKKYLKDKQMSAIKLTQSLNLNKKKLDFLQLFQKKEEDFSLVPDNIIQEIQTWEKEKDKQPEQLDDIDED